MSIPEITPEELAAWADGEIVGERAEQIAAAVAVDPDLAAQVAAHRALKDKLSAHFAPIAAEPVPARFSEMLGTASAADTPPAEVVDFAAARQRIEERRKPRWGWAAGTAIAASLVVVALLPRGWNTDNAGYADTQLAGVLETTLVGEQGDFPETRVLLSFRNEGGEFCRAFSQGQQGGIACRDGSGWRMEAMGVGAPVQNSEFRQAGASEILSAAQLMADGPALDAEAEAAAREAGWRD